MKKTNNYLNQAGNEILKSWKYIYKLHLMFNLSFQMGKMWFLSDFESAPIVGVRRADRVGYVWNCWSLGLSSHQPLERKTNLLLAVDLQLSAKKRKSEATVRTSSLKLDSSRLGKQTCDLVNQPPQAPAAGSLPVCGVPPYDCWPVAFYLGLKWLLISG